MKKICCMILLFGSLMGIAHADYQNYLYDNANYPIIYAHMGGANYLDTSSVTLKKSDADSIIFAQNQILAEYNRDITEIKEVRAARTVWFYQPRNPSIQATTTVVIDGKTITLPPYVDADVAYVSYDNAQSWTPFNVSDTYGYNLAARNAFLLGYQIATGYAYSN